MIGALALGDAAAALEAAGEARDIPMIREKTPLSSVNFDLLKQAATTAAFPAEIRRKKFGGVV